MDDLARRVDDGFAEELRTRPGFVSYEFVDCGDGEILTISMFADANGAEASRELARDWTEENLADMEFRRLEALHGEVMVSRAAGEMLEPAHAGTIGKFASVRRYVLRTGEVGAVMHTVDQVFADQIGGTEGFEAYHALDCGRGEILSISMFRDQTACEESDEQALRFVNEHLGGFDIARTEVIGGEICVSRALSELLQPAHA
jgi:hypothetical protein